MKRVIKTFEPDADVAKMLSKATRNGIRLGWLCNEALRRHLKEKGFAIKSKFDTN